MQKKGYTAWIGTNTMRNSLGIYTVSINGDTLRGEIKHTEKAYNTGALALSKDGKRLYAASEGMSFMGYGSGGVMSYRIDGGGKLVYLNGTPFGGNGLVASPWMKVGTHSTRQIFTAAAYLWCRYAMMGWGLSERSSLPPSRNTGCMLCIGSKCWKAEIISQRSMLHRAS